MSIVSKWLDWYAVALTLPPLHLDPYIKFWNGKLRRTSKTRQSHGEAKASPFAPQSSRGSLATKPNRGGEPNRGGVDIRDCKQTSRWHQNGMQCLQGEEDSSELMFIHHELLARGNKMLIDYCVVVKCDNGRPVCSKCTQRGAVCVYATSNLTETEVLAYKRQHELLKKRSAALEELIDR